MNNNNECRVIEWLADLCCAFFSTTAQNWILFADTVAQAPRLILLTMKNANRERLLLKQVCDAIQARAHVFCQLADVWIVGKLQNRDRVHETDDDLAFSLFAHYYVARQ